MGEKQRPSFPFHYWQEADAYTFYRVPKILFQNALFGKLSTDAKLLYGLLLDRMQLSMKNGWIDEDGRVYIYFTVDSIMEALSCGNKKAGSLLAELDDKRGIGLITRVRQGLGKPDKIFVHKCALPEMSKGHFQRCQNDTSGDVETTRQEMSKGHANNTEINHTDMSETDLIYPSDGMGGDGTALREYGDYRDYFMRQLSFDALLADFPYDHEILYEILELVVETVCSSRKYIRICGEDKPKAVVVGRLMKLDSEHIRYILGCLKENTTKVRNIKQYLLATLYNAPGTINSYYTALVNHDLYGSDS